MTDSAAVPDGEDVATTFTTTCDPFVVPAYSFPIALMDAVVVGDDTTAAPFTPSLLPPPLVAVIPFPFVAVLIATLLLILHYWYAPPHAPPPPPPPGLALLIDDSRRCCRSRSRRPCSRNLNPKKLP